ncbi:MAG: hypothetical protein HOI95_13410 [Chromatiales bacterium]|nr:hypothetical protein [Chromatiales bacterium]
MAVYESAQFRLDGVQDIEALNLRISASQATFIARQDRRYRGPAAGA